MSYDLAAVGGSELIRLDAVFDRVSEVDDVWQAVRVALIRADRNMTVVEDDIAGHPILGIRGRRRQLHRVLAEKDEQIAASAEVDIRIGIFALAEISVVTRVDIGVDHILETVSRRTEGLPDDVGADAVVVSRVAARVIRAFILRIRGNVSPRALDHIGVIVDPVAVGIVRALYILKAEILSAVYMKMTVEHHHRGRQNDRRTDA